MSTVPLRDVAQIVRSKNAGPFRLTLDVLFKEEAVYRRVKESGAVTRETIARLYRLRPDEVTDFVWFDPAKALKATVVRRVSSAAVGDTDVYGAQQHAPLLDLELPAEVVRPSSAAALPCSPSSG